jgi:hypothetical protein
MGEYVPQAPINDEAKKHNENLPGLGGVFNYVNLHAYHYAGNNPVVLRDLDGREIIITITMQVVGTGKINDYHEKGSTSETFMIVPTYRVNVTNTETGAIWSFEMTRAAHDAKENPSDFTFNPGADYKGFYLGRIELRPDGSGEAVRILNQDGQSATMFSSELNETNIDGSIFIHVGGLYYNPKRKENRYAVSTGCFTINGRDAGNNGIDRFISVLKFNQEQLVEMGHEATIKIIIEPLERE